MTLELKVPPALLVLLTAGGMWLLARLLPGLDPGVPMAWRLGLGVLLGFTGVGIILAGVSAFRHHGTTVDPLHPDAASQVVRTGIYRRTRNPMYLGFTVALLGWAVGLGHPAALLVLPVFPLYLTRFQIRPEERALGAKFGDAYTAYLQDVPRWL
ncbi:MAG TPA: isoprenylcysteine carboxylmethyltransferase family protein [Holophagaceae bacterium]|nr:isoprenylcysteine carboxylmethyltransferase family protein [Holophagaceae bacterium]